LAASNTQGPDLEPLYIAHRHRDALWPIRGTPSGRSDAGGGVAGVTTTGLLPEARSPEADARRSRFEGLYHLGRLHGAVSIRSSATRAFKAALRTPSRCGWTAEKTTAFVLPEESRRISSASTAPPAAIIPEEKDPLNGGYFEEWYAVDTRGSGRYGFCSE